MTPTNLPPVNYTLPSFLTGINHKPGTFIAIPTGTTLTPPPTLTENYENCPNPNALDVLLCIQWATHEREQLSQMTVDCQDSCNKWLMLETRAQKLHPIINVTRRGTIDTSALAAKCKENAKAALGKSRRF